VTKKGAKAKKTVRRKSSPKIRKASVRPEPVEGRAIAKRQPQAIAPAADELLEPRLPDPSVTSKDALGRLRSIETLEESYLAWGELRALHAQAQAAYSSEKERIEGQGEFLLGAVKVARNLGAQSGKSGGLAKAGDIDTFIAETSARIDAARVKLEGAVESSESRWARALEEARQTVLTRVERTAKVARPVLKLFLRSLAGSRRILHLERVSGDAPVITHFVLTGTVPSRYDFLFDDSTDDAMQAPPWLYAEEGAGAADTRATAPRVFELLAAAPRVFPSKGMIPVRVPQPAATLQARFLQRGPVAEAEIADGDGWRGILTVEEAEVIAGWLIKLQLEGKLSVALARG
jgi:hypothetical protein